MNRARSIVVAVDRRTRFSVFKLLSIVVLAVLAISFEGTCQVESARACDVQPARANEALPMHVWWTRAGLAMGLLDRAQEFDITAIILENDFGHVGWNKVAHGLCLYDFSDRCRLQGEHRAKVEAFREEYRRICRKSHQLGIDSYVMCPELHVPQSFGKMSFDDPELWDLVHKRLREIFQAIPELDGFVLYLAEGQLDVELMPGNEPSKSIRAKKLITTCWEACKAENRKFMVSTFIHNKLMLDAIAEALREIPPDPNVIVLQDCCPNDWGLYELANSSNGHMGPHPEIIGFDTCGENWGQGAHPFIQVEYMVRRMQQARADSKTIAGVAGFTGWLGGRSALGTLNEANVYACQALRASPDRDGRGISSCRRRWDRPTRTSCLARARTSHP
jgi:hypothetical protein